MHPGCDPQSSPKSRSPSRGTPRFSGTPSSEPFLPSWLFLLQPLGPSGRGQGREGPGCQAGWVSPTEGGGESPSRPGRSPKCTEEGVGRSGSSLGSLPPSKRGGPWRMGTGWGSQVQIQAWCTEGPVLLCRWSSCAGTPFRTSRLTGKKLTRR